MISNYTVVVDSGTQPFIELRALHSRTNVSLVN
jgi:hypothetical protein